MTELKLKAVSESLILSRMRFENPWWETDRIEPDYEKMPRRLYFPHFFTFLNQKDVNRAIVLMGPRRVGKTVMMHQAIGQLIKDGVPAKKIAFVNIENPIFINCHLEEIFAYIRQAVNDFTYDGWYIFFDEIQYKPDWEVHLKVLVDSYRGCRFVVSGSAASNLRMKSLESGAGRFHDFMLPPLTFQEYIVLKDKNHLVYTSPLPGSRSGETFYQTHNIEQLNAEFIHYLNFGGYPEVIFSETIRLNPGLFIRSDIIDKVLLRDLPSLYGIQDVQQLYRLFATLVYNTGAEMSYQSISSEAGISKKNLKDYLNYLESAYLIRMVHRVDENARNFKRTDLFKIYLTNPSLRTALFAPLNPLEDAMGPMVETAIFAQWLHRGWNVPNYARWFKNRTQGEVDMVSMDKKTLRPEWVVEIKWSNYYVRSPKDLKSLLQFCVENGLKEATVTTIDKTEEVEIKGVQLHFVPASLYAYNVAANTLEQRA